MEHNTEHLNSCPICNHQVFTKFLKPKDHTVSQANFQITKCGNCDFLFTNPRPTEDTIGQFYESDEYISHSNTNKGLVNSLYQTVRKHTIKKKVRLINGLIKKGSILDIGSGTGEFLNACSADGWQTLGIEPSETGRNSAIKNYQLDVRPESEIPYLTPRSFDIITMWHVLEHVPQLNSRINELKTLLKPNGKIIVAVPNPNSYDAKHYGEHWAAYDVPRHLYHFKPTDIINLFNKHNFVVLKSLPMIFDSFYVSMLSEKYQSGKGNILKGFLVGLLSNLKATFKPGTSSSQIYLIENQ